MYVCRETLQLDVKRLSWLLPVIEMRGRDWNSRHCRTSLLKNPQNSCGWTCFRPQVGWAKKREPVQAGLFRELVSILDMTAMLRLTAISQSLSASAQANGTEQCQSAYVYSALNVRRHLHEVSACKVLCRWEWNNVLHHKTWIVYLNETHQLKLQNTYKLTHTWRFERKKSWLYYSGWWSPIRLCTNSCKNWCISKE